MDYLYIPTTTLNFNNILSTGSISPAAAYAARQFGYKQFEVVDPNPYRNVLLLYDRYPKFTIEDADRDSHPLVLRLRADRLPGSLTQKSERKGGVGIYVCDETVYFDPASTDIFFPSADIQRTVLSKSEPSLTTKLVELCRPRLRIPSPELDVFKWTGDTLEGIRDGKKEAVLGNCDTDSRINRLKGFMSGYIVGAYKSIDPKIARMRSSVRAIRNEVSAMLNDPEIKYSKTMRKEVDFSCSTLEQFFIEVGLGARRFDPAQGDTIEIDHGAFKVLRDHHETGSGSAQSLVQFVNEYCLSSGFCGPLDEQRLDVALDGAKALRTLIGSEWEGSSHQKYINALLNNIKNGSAFDFNGSNSLIIQSFAAFILKGDDLQKLEDYLIANSIGDFRIAFALWGVMFGFSKIPKTIYNLPFQQGEAEYATRMHTYVHRIVHRIPLDEICPPTVIQAEPPVDVAPPMRSSSLSLLDQLQQELPGSTPWHTNLGQLLSTSGGLCKGFLALLKKTKVSELGAKPQKGITKKDVVSFFEGALASQHSDPELPLVMSQTGKFWDDLQAWDILRTAVPSECQHRVKDTLAWFQREIQDPDSKYYGWRNENVKTLIGTKPLGQRTNREAITAFCRLLGSNKDLDKKAINDVQNLLIARYN